MLIPSTPTDSTVSHALFTEILQDYVHQGKVNYETLCNDPRLEKYISQLAQSDPTGITDINTRFAFWLNAYNAFTLKIICDNYPVESINELHWGGLYIGTILQKTIWDQKFIRINNSKISLNQIEHEIVRAGFKDPRAHFALVCASISCPSLRPEAYEGFKLDEQLNDQGLIFFSQKNKNRFDLEKKTVWLSKILDWFEDDFGQDDEEVLLYITRFLPEKLTRAIKSNASEWKVKYTKYNWGLNE